MRAVRLALVLAIAFGLTGCGSTQKVMPSVVGLRLDIALSDIERAGVNDEVEVLGGGLFGVIDKSNWQVCDQEPAAGAAVTAAPRVTVDRACNTASGPTTTPTQTATAPSEGPTEQPTNELASPTPAVPESVDDEAEVDMSNYKVHKLPKNIDKWSDQEWEWWSTAALEFQSDYEASFEDHFGDTPSEEVLKVAQDFAEESCSHFDEGRTVDDIAEGIADSGGSQKAQAALLLAVRPGVKNFCPWNSKKLR